MYSFGFIIDTQIGIALLYLLYRLLLSGRIPLSACRVYLLLIVPAAAAVAWVDLPVLNPVEVEVAWVETSSVAPLATPVAAKSESFDSLFWLYAFGVAACVIWSLVGLVRILIAATRSQKQKGVYFCKDNIASGSFFSMIIVDERYRDSDMLNAIIVHESIHSRYLHSLDLLYINALRALLWFNPAVWFIGNSLSEVHECQADRRVIDLGFSPQRYIETLLAEEVGFTARSVGPNSLTHYFSYSLTKNRIKMITKFNTRLSTLRLLAVLPFLGAMLCMMSFTHQETTATTVSDSVSSSESNLVAATSSQADLTYTFMPVATKDGQNAKPTNAKPTKAKASVSKDSTLRLEDITVVRFKSGTHTFKSGPLIMVDGKEASTQDVNPNQIKSVTVLKDSTALKLYGQKGINGVVIIETKNADKDTQAFIEAEEMPSFQGGDLKKFSEWISKNLVYPEQAVKQKIQGRVIVGFTVNKTGQVGQVNVIHSSSDVLNATAIEVVEKSPLWEPGKNQGKPVNVKYVIPIHFSL